MLQFSDSPAIIPFFTASLLITGSCPGKPMHTGQTLEFGAALNESLEQRQNIFVLVLIWQ
jgi:hypothetical protein